MLFIEREERRELLEPPNQAPQGLRLDRPVQGDFSVRAGGGYLLERAPRCLGEYPVVTLPDAAVT
jgi:hypothetical protein